jgi:hypothetical protein
VALFLASTSIVTHLGQWRDDASPRSGTQADLVED